MAARMVRVLRPAARLPSSSSTRAAPPPPPPPPPPTLRPTPAPRARPPPSLGAAPRDERPVAEGLSREARLAVGPGRHAFGAGVIGRCGKADIAELVPEIGEQVRGMDDGRFRLEGIVQPAIQGGARHELRDALRT